LCSGLGARLATVTLATEGLIFHLGHGGKACLWPVEPPIPMTVIDKWGTQTVNVKYCGCGNFEPGPAGDWGQIVDIGWYRAALIHPRVCSTFRVLSESAEAEYLPA
jgi:hypothetical protein